MVKDNFNIIPPLSQLSYEEKELHEASKDLIKFGQIFFPKDFVHKEISPEFHYIIGKQYITTKPGARICSIIFRGGAKSTLKKVALLHKIYFGEIDDPQFFAWLCEVQYQAINHITYVKNHIDFNKKLQRYFGVLSGDAVGKPWTRSDFVTAKGDRLVALGLNQKPRGIVQEDLRLAGACLDDFESEENTKTEERRRYNKEWVAAVIFPALEETGGKEGWIWLSGTIVHWDSYLAGVYRGWLVAQENKTDFTWDVNYYEATDKDRLQGKPTWPDRFPIKKLEKKLQEFKDSGAQHKFWQEYFNDPRDVESLPFNPEKVQEYFGAFHSKGNFAYLHINEEYIPIHVYIGVDLAATATTHSDYQAIVVMGIDSGGNRYVLDRFYSRIPMYDMPAKIIEYARQYYPVKGGAIETVAAQEIIRDAVARMSAKDKKLVPWMWGGVKPPPGIKKEDRILEALGSLVHNKKLFIKREHNEILDEMMDFPKGRRDDYLDALYYANYYARHNLPKSNPISEEDFGEVEETERRKKKKKRYDWYTGKAKYVDDWVE